MVSRLANPDWGVETPEDKSTHAPEDLTEFPSADESLGQTAVQVKAVRLGDNVRQAEMARQAAVLRSRQNGAQNANLRVRVLDNEILRGTAHEAGQAPVFEERAPVVLDSGERAFHFPATSVPGNAERMVNSLLDDIGSTFALNAAIILNQLSGNTSHSQMFTSTELTIKRFTQDQQRMFEGFLELIFVDMYRDDINAERADRSRELTLDGRDQDIDLLWQGSGVEFFIPHKDFITYDEWYQLYLHKVIDEETFLKYTHDLFGVREKQTVRPSDGTEPYKPGMNLESAAPLAGGAPKRARTGAAPTLPTI